MLIKVLNLANIVNTMYETPYVGANLRRLFHEEAIIFCDGGNADICRSGMHVQPDNKYLADPYGGRITDAHTVGGAYDTAHADQYRRRNCR